MASETTRIPGTPFVIVERLGEGASGEVFRAVHEDLRRDVVIKRLRAELVDRKDRVARLRTEAQVLARIRHPSLVEVHDFRIDDEGRPLIVMGFVEGESLRAVADRRGRIGAEEAARWVAGALDGLAEAHAAGVVHRDLKPENLMLTRDDRLVVLDFGVAKLLEGADDAAQTREGMVVGTARYMAPEQARGDVVTPAADLYAMGCVLFELIVGAPPFVGGDARSVLYRHVHEKAPSIADHPQIRVEPRVVALVDAALAKKPAERPMSAAAMARALREIVGASSTEVAGALEKTAATEAMEAVVAVSPAGPSSRTRVVAIVASIAAAMFAGASLRRAHDEPRAVAPIAIAIASSAPSSIAPTLVAVTATPVIAPSVVSAAPSTPLPARARIAPQSPSPSPSSSSSPLSRASTISASIPSSEPPPVALSPSVQPPQRGAMDDRH